MSQKIDDLLAEVKAERFRQIEKWGEQHHPDGTSTGWAGLANARKKSNDETVARSPGALTWRAILDEEIAEAWAEIEPGPLREEILQCAAVCLAWVEDMDSREATDSRSESA